MRKQYFKLKDSDAVLLGNMIKLDYVELTSGKFQKTVFYVGNGVFRNVFKIINDYTKYTLYFILYFLKEVRVNNVLYLM